MTGRRRATLFALLALIGAVALLAAGCGGGDSESAADETTVETTTETTTETQSAQAETRSPEPPAASIDNDRPVGTSGAQASEPATGRTELPRTASPLELSGLLGLLSLLSGLGLRVARQ